MDPLVADESSVSSYYSISNTSVSSSLSLESLGSGGKDEKKPHAKICDIADILNLESFEEENRLTGSEQHDKNFWIFFEQQISYNNNDDCDSIVRCLRTKAQENQTLGFEKSKVDLCDLVKGSKQLSPSDYNRSLYNRPIAFEKDSRLWARNLLHTFKTGNSVPTSNNDNSKNQIENILSDSNSSIYNDNSFEANVEYIQKLNDENNYSAYLNYLQSNRSKLWYTLTDSLDVIDGLLGKIVSF
ncbi:unnamed protein product [Didymodactylos carnosus]|uniref:Uncharacterized protein n=1 Tax=Didymodactylos carnosus TaxID=1234261 RepID=A0A814DX89_9BILA|nr:unnamed protein product [Didymodactylos carnosus]CAF1390199.1 unnamed protein product [Didymodactylos carnosus]CAF3737407.1 unnamed protein product [Didymodactylos carnosus]CAF4197894.1 unnamed protein product [Didymodactylos carnosus]